MPSIEELVRSKKSGSQLEQRVEKAITEFTNGGKLTTEQMDKFITIAQENAKLFSRFRIIRTKSDSFELPKLSMVGDMFKASPTVGSTLSGSLQFNPTDGKVSLSLKKLFAEIPISYDTLALNVEQDAFLDTLLTQVAIKAAKEYEEFAIKAETGSVYEATDKLDLIDGVIKQVTDSGNIYNALGSPFDHSIITGGMNQLGDAYLDNVDKMVVACNNKTYLNYADKLATRNTALGDGIIAGTTKLRAHGATLVGTSSIPSDKTLIFDPSNVAFGIKEDMAIHWYDSPREQVLYLILISRCDAKIIDSNGMALITEVGNVTI